RLARTRLPHTCRGLATTLAAGRAALARRPALPARHAPLAERPLAGLDPPAEGGAVRLRQQLLESRQHDVLFLGHVVLDVLLEGGDVARHAPHETGQPAAALEAGEELLDAVVVLLDELDGVHVIPPRFPISVGEAALRNPVFAVSRLRRRAAARG